MKLFWKIFFAIMFISTICFSVGGCILVRSNFNSLLQNEVSTAYELGDIAYFSLSRELLDTTKTHNTENSDNAVIEQLETVANSISIQNTGGKIRFAILNEEKDVVFSSLKNNFDKKQFKNLSAGEKGYSINKSQDGYYIQAVRPAIFWGTPCYIETTRDVSFVFQNQYRQYKLLVYIMVTMLFLVSILTFVISKLLIRKIVLLNTTVMKISSGKINERVAIKGADEVTLLSQNFNKMADELERNIHTLEEQAEKQEMFVAAFSHELKTPLTSIIGYADTLRRKEMSNERVKLCANYIFNEGKRLETLSMRLLDLIVLKNQALNRVPVNIQIFFDELKNVLQPQLEKANVKLNISVVPLIVNFETELMKTVFLNLIDNARKALAEKSGGLISIIGVENGEGYTVEISDNGKGIAATDLVKIKEAFFMVDKSRSRKQGGAGLGLSICEQIIKLHGYEMRISSEIGEGTVVRIILKGENNNEVQTNC